MGMVPLSRRQRPALGGGAGSARWTGRRADGAPGRLAALAVLVVVALLGGRVTVGFPGGAAPAAAPRVAAPGVPGLGPDLPAAVSTAPAPLPPAVLATGPRPTSLAPPTGLQIVALDSSLHVTWTPSADPATAWHVVSVWDGATLQQAKVASKTARAVQTNGLVPGHAYAVKVQAMDAAGNLSAPIAGMATTDPQSPMRNAAFFENFNGPPGDLDANYFDVRTSHGTGLQPDSIGVEKMLVFNSENHFHTQMIGGKQRGELYIRPRVPFDFAGRTGTFETEVDTPAVLHSDGKWFEIHLVQDIPWSSEEFGAGIGSDFPNSIEFSVRAGDGPDPSINIPQITVNINGITTTYTGTLRQLTPTNIRMPVVLKVSPTSAEFFINGVSVVRADGWTLPFTRGYWLLAHRSWYGSRDTQTSPVVLQLLHWDMVQFDGPAGSYNPVVRTYIQPGCSGVVHDEHDGILGCPKIAFWADNPANVVTLPIPDDVTQARSVRLLYNGSADSSFTVTVNGHPLTIPTKTCCFFDALNTAEIPPAWLQQGANTLAFTYNGALGALPDLAQVELEVVYNQPRMLPVPAVTVPMPMLALSTASFRVDHRTTDPPIYTATTYLSSFGAGDPVVYTATMISTETPWLSISPAAGTIRSAALGGGVVPLTLAINFAGLTTDGDGEVGVIKITGGVMPVYLAVLAVADGSDQVPVFLPTLTGANTTFNKDAIPDYYGPCSFADVPADYWAAPYITSLACRGIVNGYADGTFRPGATVTRGQFAKILVLGQGWPFETTGGPHFADVPPANPFYAPIETALLYGVISGYGDGTFGWGNAITRSQLAKIVVLARGWPLLAPATPHFSDVPADSVYYSYVETAFAHGLIAGYADGTFRPGTSTTRAQVAKIMYTALSP